MITFLECAKNQQSNWNVFKIKYLAMFQQITKLTNRMEIKLQK